MGNCAGCKRNCCGNKFQGLEKSFKHSNPDLFDQIILSKAEVARIKKIGAEQYIEYINGLPCITLNKDNSCKAFKDGMCTIYDARPDVCRLYPFYFDPFVGILIDKNCPGFEADEFEKADPEFKKEIFKLVKNRVKLFEEIEKKKNSVK